MSFKVIVIGLLFAIVLVIVAKRCDSSYYDNLDFERQRTLAKDSLKQVAGIRKKDSANHVRSLIKASCPVSILKQVVVENSIGTPEAHITLKNKSNKIIDGIKLEIACFNNFNEPVNFAYSNIYNGILQDRVKSGATITRSWTLVTRETTTKVFSEIIEVHFTDGTRWDFKSYKSQ